MKAIERAASEQGLSFAEAARLLAGASVADDGAGEVDRDWGV